jgi:hypothetical protein
MNKQELLDKAVHALGGVFDGTLPKYNHEFDFWVTTSAEGVTTLRAVAAGFSITKEEFQQRARELGYINGYRWGVEYPTNGKKPDLDSSILVYVVDCHAPYSKEAPVIDIHWPRYDTFEIIDERYKPADTSYLDASTVKESLTDDWWDYDNQEMKKPPKVNTEVEMLWGGVYQCRVEYIGAYNFKAVFYRFDVHEIDNAESPTVTFRPLDWNRKAEAEKKRVVDAAMAIAVDAHMTEDILGSLYDAGYLKLPTE